MIRFTALTRYANRMAHPSSIGDPPGGTAGQPPTAPPGGGFTPTRGRGLPLTLMAGRAGFIGLCIFLLALIVATVGAASDAPETYAAECAACHGAERLGGTGPALIPQTLRRIDRKSVV